MTWQKAKIEKYKVTIREPDWQNSIMLWEEFSSSEEAEDFIKETAFAYPEGTLLYVTAMWSGSPKWAPRGVTTRKAFIVNEFGEAVSRARKWIPEGMVAKEWVKSLPEVELLPEPEEPELPESSADLRDLSDIELMRMRRLLADLDPEGTRKLRLYEAAKEEYESRRQEAEEFPKRTWFRPGELRGTEVILKKMLGEWNEEQKV